MKPESCQKETPLVPTKKMHLHPLTLAFRHDQKHLEKKFLDHYFIGSLPIVRFTCFFAIIVYAAFGILDACLIPEKKNIFWFIRYAIFCPFAFGVFLFSFTPLFRKMMQPVLACLMILAGAGIIYMILVASSSVAFSYYAGLILVFMMGYTAVKLRFIWATCAGWLLVFLYEVATIFFVEIPDPILLNNNFFFIGANLIGMFACYTIEYYARHDFYLQDLLEKEQENVRNARNRLEEKVRERTAKLKKTHEQLLHSEKLAAIGRLSASIAHEFNNPLAGIQSVIEGIKTHVALEKKDQVLIDLALSECRRVKGLIKNLQDLNRPSSGVKETVDIHSLLNNMILMVKKDFKDSHITIKKQYASELPMIQAVCDQIKQVMLNLLTNAKDATTDDNAKVTITTERLNDKIAVYISDTGSGISPETLPHIFEPFFTTKSAVKGTGLGLSVSYGIIKSHGGTIEVDSSLNVGTTFSVFLPIADGE